MELLIKALSRKDRRAATMMDELIQAVARAAALPPEQAALAVAAVLRFCTARLPSALVGELHARLRMPLPPADLINSVSPTDSDNET